MHRMTLYFERKKFYPDENMSPHEAYLIMNDPFKSDMREILQRYEMANNKHPLSGYSSYVTCGDLYAKHNMFDEAISDYTESIKLNPENSTAYQKRGVIYHKQEKITEAISDYIKSIEIYKCKANVKLLEFAFLDLKNGDLDAIGKQDIFNAIKKFPKEKQISLLNQCLVKGNPLGERMWKTEFPWTGCGYEKGILKDICDYLKIIDPNFVMPTQSVKLKLIFNDQSARKAQYPDLNHDDGEYNQGFRL